MGNLVLLVGKSYTASPAAALLWRLLHGRLSALQTFVGIDRAGGVRINAGSGCNLLCNLVQCNQQFCLSTVAGAVAGLAIFVTGGASGVSGFASAMPTGRSCSDFKSDQSH